MEISQRNRYVYRGATIYALIMKIVMPGATITRVSLSAVCIILRDWYLDRACLSLPAFPRDISSQP